MTTSQIAASQSAYFAIIHAPKETYCFWCATSLSRVLDGILNDANLSLENYDVVWNHTRAKLKDVFGY